MGRAQSKRSKSVRPGPPPREGRPDRLRSQVGVLLFLAGGVAVIVLAAHWPALSARALSFDDNQYLTENPLVQNPSASSARRFLSEVLEPSTVRGYYQPLAMISLMLDTAMGGSVTELRPYHRTSLVLHVANTVLVIVLLYMLFGQPWVAALVGLLFGVHPMTVEVIPWVGERKTVLTTFFSLSCLVLYVRFTRTGGWRSYVGSMVTYVLALMSKPTSTALPLLMLLWDYWPIGRLSRRTLLEKVPFFVVAGVSAVITYVSQARTAAVATPARYSPMVIPLTLCHNVVFYLYKIVWPAKLSSHYPYPEPFDLSQPMVLAGVIGTAVLSPVLLISWRWTRALVVGWVCFFVAIFPTMGVIGFTHSIASDKYAYLPSIGLLLPLAWFLRRGWEAIGRYPRALYAQAGAGAVVMVLVGLEILGTRRYLVEWRDTERLFRYMLNLAPNARILHFGLAEALRLRAPSERSTALLAEAIEHYQQATRSGPDSPFGRNDLLTCAAHNNLGNLLAQMGQIDQAVWNWSQVLRLNPNDYNAHNNLGIALGWKGRSDEAIRHYTEALRIRPDLPETHNNLGLELARRGQTDAALQHYAEAVRLKPDFAMAHKNLGSLLAAVGRVDQAVDVYRQAVRIQPFDPDARCKLGDLLRHQGRMEQAVEEYREALRVDPHYPQARRGLEAAGQRQK